MLVLVVEDDSDTRTVVRVTLECASFDVIEAGSAEEALRISELRTIDVVVLDIDLPGASGLDVLAVLRERQPGVPVIMLTGRSEEDERVSALLNGAHDYILKPFSTKELAARVLAASRHRELLQVLGAGAREVEEDRTIELAAIEDADRDIRRGLEHGEFTVYYQPVVQLATAQWTGVEALVRWEHPTRGLLEPGAFIEQAEHSGAIVELGMFVLEEACRQWARWHRIGIELHVAVNLSGRQLAEPSLARRVAQATASASMPAGTLWLEVTETSLVDDVDNATDVLRRLAEHGANVAIDDFGTGWASLTYLRRFPVDALKIDRVFVAGLGTGGNDDAIVSSIISLGAELGLDVVAEGIETREQAIRLEELGCIRGQGYLYARPAPARELRCAS